MSDAPFNATGDAPSAPVASREPTGSGEAVLVSAVRALMARVTRLEADLAGRPPLFWADTGAGDGTYDEVYPKGPGETDFFTVDPGRSASGTAAAECPLIDVPYGVEAVIAVPVGTATANVPLGFRLRWGVITDITGDCKDIPKVRPSTQEGTFLYTDTSKKITLSLVADGSDCDPAIGVCLNLGDVVAYLPTGTSNTGLMLNPYKRVGTGYTCPAPGTTAASLVVADTLRTNFYGNDFLIVGKPAGACSLAADGPIAEVYWSGLQVRGNYPAAEFPGVKKLFFDEITPPSDADKIKIGVTLTSTDYTAPGGCVDAVSAQRLLVRPYLDRNLICGSGWEKTFVTNVSFDGTTLKQTTITGTQDNAGCITWADPVDGTILEAEDCPAPDAPPPPGPPAGTVAMFAGAAAPDLWLLCDGAAVSRVTYEDLFAVIGTTYGVGDGSTTFNLPDLRSRFIVGAGTGDGLSTRALGDTGGEETHVLIAAEMPSHTHDVPFDTSGAAGGFMDVSGDNANAVKSEATGSAGGDTAHENMPPFFALTFIIKT